MRKILLCVVAVLVGLLFVSSQAFAISKQYMKKGEQIVEGGKDAAPHKDPAQMDSEKYEKGDFHKKIKISDFPEKGWHKGPYLAANIGMMQATNDKHVVTGKTFDGTFDMAFGLTFGWDIADWIGPMLQINYATASGTAGDAANDAAAQQYNLAAGESYPAGTFPSQNAREHAVNIGLYAKATLPYFTRAEWQPKMVKILPYLKIGGIGHASYVNASTSANKVGSVGGGPSFGAGCEFLIWKGFFVALDATESIVFEKKFNKNITYTDALGVSQTRNQNITAGGTKAQFQLLGMFGWHF